ncbi:PAS domain S-box protein [Hymenobacter sp. HD11105]
MSASGTSGAARAAAHAAGLPSPLSVADTSLLLASLPWGVLALAPDGTVAVLNPAAEALWGVPAAAVLGHAPAQVRPAVLPPGLLQALAEMTETSPPATYWLSHTRQWITMRTAPAADGRRWVYWDNAVASQQPSGRWPAATDPYEGRMAHDTLREAEERYRTLFEAMAQGFCVVEVLFDGARQPVDYRFLVTNPAFEQQTGLGPAVGQTMRTLRPEHEAHWFELYGQVALTGEPQRFARLAEQLERFYEVYAFRVGDPSEHQVAILFSDISGVRRTEAALREAEASFRTLFNSIDEGYFLCDVLFDEHAVPVDIFYRDANPAATRLVGADFRGRRLLDIDPAYEGYWVKIFGRVAQTGVGERLEEYADPDQKWYSFYISKVGDEASRRVAVVFQDITERKQNEQARQQSEAQIAADLVGMRRLYELQAKLADQTDVQAAFQDVLALACAFTGTDRGCVQFLSEDGQRLEMFVWQGYPDDSPFIDFFRYEGLETGCEVARVQRKRLIIEDTVGFEGLAGTEAGAAAYADGIRASQSTPMTSRAGETMGVISTQFRQPHRPSDHVLRLMDMLAWTAAEFLERHRADAALRESEALLQKAFSVDTVGQLYFTLDGRMTAANPALVRMSGYRREQLLTLQWEVLTAPEFRDITSHHAGELAERGDTAPYEKQFVRPDGSRWWGLCAPTRLRGAGPTAECMEFIVDISERKQAEQQLEAFTTSLEVLVAERTHALLESQELLQSVFDTSLISLSVLKAVRDEAGVVRDFRIALANKELGKETGRHDLVGKLYTEEFPGIKLTALYELMLGVLETGEPAGLEYSYPHEGFHKWYAGQFVKMDDGLVATNLDITERKLAEEKNQEQAHFIARINETIPDLITVMNLDSGRALYHNRDQVKALGYEREKLLQLSFQERLDLLQMHPDDAARLPQYLARVRELPDHEIATFSYRAKLNTNQWSWFEVRGSAFQRDPATGVVTQVLNVTQDVSAQKEAEYQQNKSYQLLQQSEEVASLGSWDYDRVTGEFLWSAGMYRLFGLPPGSPIRPETYFDFALPEDRAVAERIVRGLTSGRTGFEETLRIQVGKAVKTVRVKAAGAFDAAGEPLRMLGVDLDISEVHRLEAENLHLRLTQQQALFNAVLEAQETERRRMAESLHNGVGQTLYATKLQLDQVRGLAPAPGWGRVDALLSDAIRQTRTLSHELVPTVLTDFGLQAALHDVSRKLSGPHLRFTCTVELDDEQPLPQSLEVALYRIAQELAQNVVKHAQASEASLALETVPGFVLLRVEDNGIGFPAPAAAGSGIGLRTIRDRVTLLGGTVELGSTPAFGTYVRIRFPLLSPLSPLA